MLNTIKIQVSANILNTYNTPNNTGLFIDNLFTLVIPPQGYDDDPILTRELSMGVTTTYVATTANARTIQIETQDSREGIKYILEEIQEEANDLTFPILDYHHPERRDRDLGFSIRNVTLKDITAIGGSVNAPFWGTLGLGWRIQFQEDVSPSRTHR